MSAFLNDSSRQFRIHIYVEISASHKTPPVVGKCGKGLGSRVCMCVCARARTHKGVYNMLPIFEGVENVNS